MSLPMPSPWKHPETGTFYLKQRVPADLVSKARGMTLGLSVAGTLWPVKVGGQVKVSLRTKDIGPAKLRYREADDSLQQHWARLRSDVVELTHRQILEIAGEVYRKVIAEYDAEPGDTARWKEMMRGLVAVGASDATHRPNPTTVEARALGAFETALTELTELVLDERGIRVADSSRSKVRIETLIALAQASSDNLRKAEGDYSPSRAADRFPTPAPVAKPKPGSGTGPKLTDLFDHWSKVQQREGKSPSTTRRWKPVIASLVSFLGHDDAANVTDDDIIRWRSHLIETKKASPGTFNRNHISAVRVLYRQENGKVANLPDPTAGLKWKVAKPVQTRPKGFTTEEAKAILRAANEALTAPGKTSEVMRRVQRWVPWLCAYTGARVGEITQLRGADVMTIDGVACIRITPEAGTVKTRHYRDVPLHPHLIEMGFPAFAEKRGSGPLFYSPDLRSETPWEISSIKLAAWVRGTAGVTDPKVQPNHGWRQVFHTHCRLVGIDRFYENGICGQSIGTTQGDRYGDTPIAAVLREISKLPRWEV